MSGALMAISLERDLVKVPPLRIVQMHGAGQARVKGMDGAQNLDRFVDLGHRRADQRLLEGGALALGVARRAVPGGGHDELIVFDGAVVNLDVVSQSAARSLSEANALGVFGPSLWLPAVAVECGNFVDLDPFHQLAVVALEPNHRQSRVESARGGATESREERADGDVELAQRILDQLLN